VVDACEVPRNRFNGFAERVPPTRSSSTVYRVRKEETVKTVLQFLNWRRVTGLKLGLNENNQTFEAEPQVCRRL